jgi:hypothetical protein
MSLRRVQYPERRCAQATYACSDFGNGLADHHCLACASGHYSQQITCDRGKHRPSKDKVPVGQSPWVNLRVENLTDREITISEAVPHVEGDEGELPRKPNTEIITDRAQPRLRLRTVVYVAWTIAPKDSSIHQYKLAHFFDLSRPGEYTVHMEVADPSSHKLLRTNSAKFEMQSPRH